MSLTCSDPGENTLPPMATDDGFGTFTSGELCRSHRFSLSPNGRARTAMLHLRAPSSRRLGATGMVRRVESESPIHGPMRQLEFCCNRGGGTSSWKQRQLWADTRSWTIGAGAVKSAFAKRADLPGRPPSGPPLL